MEEPPSVPVLAASLGMWNGGVHQEILKAFIILLFLLPREHLCFSLNVVFSLEEVFPRVSEVCWAGILPTGVLWLSEVSYVNLMLMTWEWFQKGQLLLIPGRGLPYVPHSPHSSMFLSLRTRPCFVPLPPPLFPHGPAPLNLSPCKWLKKNHLIEENKWLHFYLWISVNLPSFLRTIELNVARWKQIEFVNSKRRHR